MSNAVDFIKPLQWLPTRTWTRARWVHDALIDTYGPMILRVKERLDAKEDVEDCLAETLLLEQENGELDWEDACMLAAVFTLGGVHSVSFMVQGMTYLASILTRPLVDHESHPLVPCIHCVTCGCAETCTRRA